jgi:hypothetical protein
MLLLLRGCPGFDAGLPLYWQSAREVVVADPQLLTCLTWEKAVARLERSGIATLAEVAPQQPQQPEEPPKRGSGRKGAARVEKPGRAAKTVKGAMEVQAAVARARRAPKK